MKLYFTTKPDKDGCTQSAEIDFDRNRIYPNASPSPDAETVTVSKKHLNNIITLAGVNGYTTERTPITDWYLFWAKFPERFLTELDYHHPHGG